MWGAAGGFDSVSGCISELLNVNRHPPQCTGVATVTAEDETGPQTLMEVNAPYFKMGAKLLSESS